MLLKKDINQYNEAVPKMFPEIFDTRDKEISIKTVTFQVTDACNLQCSYCYQINKGVRKMTFDTAKKVIDDLLTQEKSYKDYLCLDKTPGIIIDFIGGEPFLEVELMDKICDYFLEQCIKLNHPWALHHMFSASSNGTLYFDEKVQNFIKKHYADLSLSITLDGNKQLHDACRLFPDGKPSYDLALSAIKHYTTVLNRDMGSKITIAPNNIDFLFDAIKNMVDLNYEIIHANPIFEKGWEFKHAIIYYNQLKKIADYLIDEVLPAEKIVYCSLFQEGSFVPKLETENENWCGGTGLMLAVDPDGFLYPCIRYMESSLGTEVESYRIGHVDTGIATTLEEQQKVKCLKCITRRSQSTDECFYCPIASGCAWCSGYNYQELGTPNARCTYICDLHKAASLANVYFWNKLYIACNLDKRKEMYCPKEWAIPIIGEEEYDLLLQLSSKKEVL